jgi:hypothetical protein
MSPSPLPTATSANKCMSQNANYRVTRDRSCVYVSVCSCCKTQKHKLLYFDGHRPYITQHCEQLNKAKRPAVQR